MPRSKQSPASPYVFAQATVQLREPGSKYPTLVQEGSAWHADCPLVLSHPDAFSPVPPVVNPRNWIPAVEQATAAPGEERNTGRAGD